TLTLKVGATIDPEASQPVEVPAKVIFLLPTSDLPERQAVVDVKGISLVLTARRRPFHEIKDFTSLGLDPTSFRIVVVKAGYLVPPIARIANPNLMALTPGAVNQDIVHLPIWPSRPSAAIWPSDRLRTGTALRGYHLARGSTDGSEWPEF